MSNISGLGGARNVDTVDASGGASPAARTQQVSGPIALGSAEFKANAAVSQLAAQGKGAKFGDRGDGPKGLQEGLKKLGFLTGPADGIYGRGTQSAVGAFQRANNLPASGEIDAATFAALDQALQVGAKARPAGAAKPNEIVFLGMGDGATHEIADLKRRGVGVHGVTDSAAGNDKVTFSVGGRMTTYDLTTDAGVSNYVRDIGVSGAKAAEIASIIKGAGQDAKDEAAQLCRAFLQAERGERTMERVVLSGHSVGDGVWGDSNGYFDNDSLEKIAKAFPKAASQVQDFLVAGCYSSSESHVAMYRDMFPSLKTFMAYTDSAPGTWSGAMVHNQRWETATKGQDASVLDRSTFSGTRKGDNIAVWNAIDGYQSNAPAKPLAELRADVTRTEPATRDYFSGAKNVENTQAGPLRDYYGAVQRMLGSPELPASERPRLEELRDRTIRMIFYDHLVKGKFQGAHKDKINAGFAAVGISPAPDFSTLSRKDALAKVTEFEQKLAAKNPKPQAALTLKPLLTDGIRDLKQSVIPNTWV